MYYKNLEVMSLIVFSRDSQYRAHELVLQLDVAKQTTNAFTLLTTNSTY